MTSPSFPDAYPFNADCVYLISQSRGYLISLRYLMFDTEEVCAENELGYWGDYLEIRDGKSENSPIMAILCGAKTIAPMQSTKNSVWMR